MHLLLPCIVFSLVVSTQALARVIDHGVVGALFDVAEEDMRDVFKRRLDKLNETGRLQQLEIDFKAKAEQALVRPSPVLGLRPTTELRTFTHDPTFVVDKTLLDHQGAVLALEGTRINPLDRIQLQKGLLFIDGDNQSHLNWAKTHKDHFYIILVKGAPFECQQQLGLDVYFDQGGHITTHYGIQQIPARIEQHGKLLQISEFKIDEGP